MQETKQKKTKAVCYRLHILPSAGWEEQHREREREKEATRGETTTCATRCCHGHWTLLGFSKSTRRRCSKVRPASSRRPRGRKKRERGRKGGRGREEWKEDPPFSLYLCCSKGLIAAVVEMTQYDILRVCVAYSRPQTRILSPSLPPSLSSPFPRLAAHLSSRCDGPLFEVGNALGVDVAGDDDLSLDTRGHGGCL